MAWTADGRHLATIGLNSVVLIWDVATRQIINRTAPAENISSLAFSPDGKYLATGYEGGLARLWSGKDWQTHIRLRGHTGGVSHLVWSLDSHTLYSAGGNTVRAWDAATGQQLRIVDGYSAPVFQVAWTADGQHLITVEGEQLVKVNVASRLPVQVAPLSAITLANRGRYEHGYATRLFVDPAGVWIAVGDTTGLTLHDAKTLQPVRHLTTGHRVFDALFSSGGERLILHEVTFAAVWNTATGAPEQLLWGPSEYDYAFELSRNPAADRLNVRFLRDSLIVIDRASGAVRFTLERPRYSFDDMTINAQGTRLAAIFDYGKSIKIWDLDSGQLLAEYTGYRLNDIAFSPDGRSLASGGHDGTVRIWPVP